MTLRHSTWQLVLTIIFVISLAISCFLGLYLYNLVLVWSRVVEHGGSIGSFGHAGFAIVWLFAYGFVGFAFLRQKLKL